MRSYPKNVQHLSQVESGLTTFVDMFCGIGGFHIAAVQHGLTCAFASDIDEHARRAYEHNHGLKPSGDIRLLDAEQIPDHDLFCAGFPCQPFSIIGNRQGFDDIRGTLFFEIVRILKVKRPRAILLENVKQLATIDQGRTMARIIDALEELGYYVSHRILDARDFGLPQKRERVLIAGTLDHYDDFPWPTKKVPMKSLNEVLEKRPNPKYKVSQRIRESRHAIHTSTCKPSIWHENKSGNISSHPYSCALRAGASYNYLLVNGERRLTPREMLRLQGFPETFEIVCNDSETRKQAGNAVPVPLVAAGIEGIIQVVKEAKAKKRRKSA